MNYCVILACGLAVFCMMSQRTECSQETNRRDLHELLNAAFDDIIMNVNGYVGNITYGPNLIKFFQEMEKQVGALSLQDIFNSLANGENLFNKLWQLILNAADIGYANTPLGGAFIHTFLEKAKSSMSLIDLFHLLVGPYSDLFSKVQTAADEAGRETSAPSQVLSDFKTLMSKLETGLFAQPPQ